MPDASQIPAQRSREAVQRHLPLCETPIDRLRTVADYLRRGQMPPPDLSAWLIDGAQRYEARALAGDPVGLDVALGLGRPGAHGWWTTEARQRRDDLMRELRRRRFLDLDDNAAARAIAATLRAPGGDPLVRAILDTGCPKLGTRQIARLLAGHFHVEDLS